MATLMTQLSHFSEWLISPEEDLTTIARPEKRIDVIVSAYNSEKWILQCLEGILAQDCRNSITVTVHDDGSSDRTVELARELLVASGVSSTLIKRSGNSLSRYGGMFYRQLLVSSASEYLAILDSDDRWLSTNKLSTQILALDGNQNAALSFHDFVVYRNLLDIDSRLHPSHLWVRHYNLRFALGAENFIGASTVMVRSNALKDLNWLGYDALRVGDFPIWLAIAMRRGVLYCPGVLGLYRARAGSLSANQTVVKSLMKSGEALRWALRGSCVERVDQVGWKVAGSIPVQIATALISALFQRRLSRAKLLALFPKKRFRS